MSVISDAFYDKFRYNRYDFENVFGMQRKLCEKLRQETSSIEDNLYLPSTETYRIIPIRFINIKDAQYDINGAYPDIGSEKAEMLTNRLSGEGKEQSLLNSDLVSWLDKMGYYIQFSSARVGDTEDNYKIESFELFDNYEKLLAPGVDYIFDNNKLYLFGEYASDKKYSEAPFTLRNIAVNLQIFEKSVAKNLNIKKTDRVPKSIFADCVKTLTKYTLKASQIKALKDSAKEIFKHNVIIGDMNTNDDEIAKVYRENPMLTPYDFVVYADENIDQNLISIYNQYLKKAKFCETNFFTLLHGDFEEELEYNESLISYLSEELTEDYAKIESKGELILTNREIQDNTTFNPGATSYRVTFHTGERSSRDGILEELEDVYNFKDAGGLAVTDNAQYKILEVAHNSETKNLNY